MSELAITLIGFGEVGSTLAEDLLANVQSTITVWDILLADPKSAPSERLKKAKAEAAASAVDAAAGAQLIISAVTAEQALAAAQDVASGALPNAPFYLDVNSASPEEKKKAAALINEAGGRYVEASIMSPIFPKRIGAPILLGGPFAREFEPVANDLGFSGARFCAAEYGTAAATKMCRSVIVKGVESLLSESLLAARYYGVEDSVLASLSDLFPGPDWKALAPYMISRSLMHGKRRAEEMREVAKTIADAGLDPLMSEACAKRQDWASQQSAAPDANNLTKMLDGMLDAVPKKD